MKKFDLKRVGALLKYDWMLEKRRVGLISLIVLGVYVVLGWFIWTMNGTLSDGQRVGYKMASIMLGYCAVFFAVLTLSSVFMVTPVLQRKFCKPQTATAYLSLPGTTLEKYVVMLGEYAMAFVVCILMFFVFYFGTAAVGQVLDHPQALIETWEGEKPLAAYSWMEQAVLFVNETYHGIGKVMAELVHLDLDLDMTDASQMTVMRAVQLAIWVYPCIVLLELGYYLVLNMLFRTHGQLKSILCYIGTQMGLNMIGSILMVVIAKHASDLQQLVETGGISPTQAVEGFVVTLANACSIGLAAMPLLMLGMYYLLYWQMKNKQAK